MKALMWACTLWVCCSCHTTSQIDVWREQATQAMQADVLDLKGFSESSKVLDVVLVTRATIIPIEMHEHCAQADGTPKEFVSRHRFRTKPGNISIQIPKLADSSAPSYCAPVLQGVSVYEVDRQGHVDQPVISLSPEDAKDTTLRFR